MNKLVLLAISIVALTASCKKEGCTDETALNYNKKADKDDNSCEYAEVSLVPTTYVFKDNQGNSTVDYSGQTDRINQLLEIIIKCKTGKTSVLNAQDLKDMFSNAGGNGNNNFSFTSTKQLKDKCFALDQAIIESYFDSIAIASQSFSQTAANGQAGVLLSGTSSYLFDKNGIQYTEVIEKAIMGAAFMHQALNYYLDAPQMAVDNTAAVDANTGKYYTQMEHHWDEAFGYFAVPTDFPTSPAIAFWGKYCNSQDANLGSNAIMMNNFLKGRYAITQQNYANRDAAITALKTMWEDICAHQAIKYMNDAIGYFGNDNAKFLHALSEAYGFCKNLRYAPNATRRMTQNEVDALVNQFGTNFWNLTNSDLQGIIATLEANY